jgi:hypothetical protein
MKTFKPYTQKECWYCGKPVDTTIPDKVPYFHSVTHGTYMHLSCFEKYEQELEKGEGKPYA